MKIIPLSGERQEFAVPILIDAIAAKGGSFDFLEQEPDLYSVKDLKVRYD